MKTAWPWVAAVISGVLLAFCYPDWNVSSLVWFWQWPLLAALWFAGPARGRKRAWWCFGLGYAAGLPFFLINLHWLGEVTVAGSIAVAFYLALYFAVWGLFAGTVGRLPSSPGKADPSNPPGMWQPSLQSLQVATLNASAWVGLEWVRGILFTGFGWNGLAIPLQENLTMIQAADLVGVTGLAFPVVFVSCVGLATVHRFARHISRRWRYPHLDFGVAMALVIAMFLYGLGKIKERPTETLDIRVLLVQLNIPIEQKWDPQNVRATLEEYETLTSAYVESSDYDLVIWPETALPGRFFYSWVQKFYNRMLEKGDFSLLSGIEFDEDPETLYNAAVLMSGSTQSYQVHGKVHLVPFGEYIPLREEFPPFVWIAGREIPFDFDRGPHHNTLKLEDSEVEIIPLICFEDTIGRVARKFISGEAPQLIVNVTNDGWFRESPGATQHLANARFRCIELRRPMARCANTGVSCVIDAKGDYHDRSVSPPFARIIQDGPRGSTFVKGALPATIALDADPPITFYARYGDVFSVTAGILALMAAGTRWGIAFRTARQKKRKKG